MYAEVFCCCCSGRWTGSFRISGTGWTVHLMKVFAPLKEVGCHGCCSVLPVFAKETEKEEKGTKTETQKNRLNIYLSIAVSAFRLRTEHCRQLQHICRLCLALKTAFAKQNHSPTEHVTQFWLFSEKQERSSGPAEQHCNSSWAICRTF